jgi:hypothetical protein
VPAEEPHATVFGLNGIEVDVSIFSFMGIMAYPI